MKLPKKILDKVSKIGREDVLEKVQADYDRALGEPGEAVGIVAAQSIGEPGTQMCIDGNEKIIIKEENEIRIVRMGEFVDKNFMAFGYEKNGEYEVCDLPKNVCVLSLDRDEKIEWKRLISCNRHESPEQLIKIKTKSGRQITATDFHSFVTRVNNQVVPISGKELKIGDRIPVMKNLSENCNAFLHVPDFIPADSDLRIIKDDKEIFSKRGLTPLPVKIELNDLFGGFIGAYLSEGNSTKSEVVISNTSEEFLSNIRKFADAFNLNYKEFSHHRGFGPSHDLKIRSSLFALLIKNMCGTGSAKKKVPDFAYGASSDFVAALLRSYFDGDGNISTTRKMIRVSSNSKELLDGIALLLTRFGIFAHKCRDKQNWLLIPYRYAPVFLSKIGSDIKTDREKLETLALMADSLNKRSQDYTDMVGGFGDILRRAARKLNYPTRYVNNFTKRQKIGRAALNRYTRIFEKLAKDKKVDIGAELEILRKMCGSDVVWDEIVDISYIAPSSDYVYDLSVDEAETFTTFDCIVTHNTMRTFHFAGVAELAVPQGLPRFIELVDARRVPKMPIMWVYLREQKGREDAVKFAASIEEVVVEKIANIIEDFDEKMLVIEFDKQELALHGINIEDAAKCIERSIRKKITKVEGNKIIFEPKGATLRTLRRYANKIKETMIMGVAGIKKAAVVEQFGEYLIQTEGTNLNDVLQLPEVDYTRTMCNGVGEVEGVLGIEAARNILLRELKRVLDDQGLTVNVRHLMLVSDLMTVDGMVKAIGRQGVSGEKISVFARAAFEETVRHLLDAALNGTSDELLGVTENIIVGQPIPMGTGTVKIAMKGK